MSVGFKLQGRLPHSATHNCYVTLPIRGPSALAEVHIKLDTPPPFSTPTITMTTNDLYAVAGLKFLQTLSHIGKLIKCPDFCLIPMGTGDSSVSQRVIGARIVLQHALLGRRAHRRVLQDFGKIWVDVQGK